MLARLQGGIGGAVGFELGHRQLLAEFAWTLGGAPLDILHMDLQAHQDLAYIVALLADQRGELGLGMFGDVAGEQRLQGDAMFAQLAQWLQQGIGTCQQLHGIIQHGGGLGPIGQACLGLGVLRQLGHPLQAPGDVLLGGGDHLQRLTLFELLLA